MPSSRRPRTRAAAPAPAPARKCGALLADAATPCSSRAQGRAKYCGIHGREYGQLTGAYKDASSRVDAMEAEIRRTRSIVGGLGTVAAVDAAVALARRYLDALGEEIDGRETHHKRFFQEVDQNHEKWLKRRRGEQEGAVRLLERLRKRREEVGAKEAAARRLEERIYEVEPRVAVGALRRLVEELHREAAVEAQQRATEEAQRRAAVEARGEPREDGWWADATWKAAQARGILGERTNAATGTGSRGNDSAVSDPARGRVTERVPPGYWPTVGPSYRLPPPPGFSPPNPQPQLQPSHFGRYPSTPQSTGERRPLLGPASNVRGHLPGATANSSWLVDVESQTRNAAQLRRGSTYRTSTVLHVRREPPAESDSGCVTTIFGVVAFFVLCLLVVVGYLLQSSPVRWA